MATTPTATTMKTYHIARPFPGSTSSHLGPPWPSSILRMLECTISLGPIARVGWARYTAFASSMISPSPSEPPVPSVMRAERKEAARKDKCHDMTWEWFSMRLRGYDRKSHIAMFIGAPC